MIYWRGPATNRCGLSHHYGVDGESAEGLFIGVGIDRYYIPTCQTYAGSADEVQTIAELVGDHFGARILRDPTRQPSCGRAARSRGPLLR